MTECFVSAARGRRQRNSTDQVLPEWSQDPPRGSAEGQERRVWLCCGSPQEHTLTDSALMRESCHVAFQAGGFGSQAAVSQGGPSLLGCRNASGKGWGWGLVESGTCSALWVPSLEGRAELP